MFQHAFGKSLNLEGLRGRDRLRGKGFDSICFNAASIPETAPHSSSTDTSFVFNASTLNASANWAMQSLLVSGQKAYVLDMNVHP